MKLISPLMLATLAISISAPIFASEGEAKKKEHFDQQKSERLQHMKSRLDLMNQEYSCVQGASSYDAIKACDDKAKSARESFEQQHKKEREKMMIEQENKRRAEFDKKMQEMKNNKTNK